MLDAADRALDTAKAEGPGRIVLRSSPATTGEDRWGDYRRARTRRTG